MEQLTFDMTEAAIQRSYDNANDEWKNVAREAIHYVIANNDEFTADDIRDYLDNQTVTTHNLSALGPIIREFKRDNYINSTNRTRESIRPVAHKKPNRVWEVVKEDQ